MSSGSSKNEETHEVKGVEEMDEGEMSNKDKMFRTVLDLYQEIKKQ